MFCVIAFALCLAAAYVRRVRCCVFAVFVLSCFMFVLFTLSVVLEIY